MISPKISLVLVGALVTLGCHPADRQPRARLDRDITKTAQAGEPYKPTAEGKLRLAQGEGTFRPCVGQPPDRVSADGTVHVSPAEAGAFHMCVEVVDAIGSADRFEWDVDVSPRHGESAAELTAKLGAHREKLRALASGLSTDGPRPCPKETANALGAGARPLLLDPGALDALRGKPPKLDTFAAWRNEEVATLLSSASAPHAVTVRSIMAQRHVLVVSTTTLRAPQMVDRTTFDSGSFTGLLHLVEVETGRSLCSTALAFESSPSLSVRWDESGPLERDFLSNGETALRTATARLVPNLSPGMRVPR